MCNIFPLGACGWASTIRPQGSHRFFRDHATKPSDRSGGLISPKMYQIQHFFLFGTNEPLEWTGHPAVPLSGFLAVTLCLHVVNCVSFSQEFFHYSSPCSTVPLEANKIRRTVVTTLCLPTLWTTYLTWLRQSLSNLRKNSRTR